MILKVYTDGGSKGNPGPSSIGGVAYLNGKKVFITGGAGFIGLHLMNKHGIMKKSKIRNPKSETILK